VSAHHNRWLGQHTRRVLPPRPTFRSGCAERMPTTCGCAIQSHLIDLMQHKFDLFLMTVVFDLYSWFRFFFVQKETSRVGASSCVVAALIAEVSRCTCCHARPLTWTHSRKPQLSACSHSLFGAALKGGRGVVDHHEVTERGRLGD